MFGPHGWSPFHGRWLFAPVIDGPPLGGGSPGDRWSFPCPLDGYLFPRVVDAPTSVVDGYLLPIGLPE